MPRYETIRPLLFSLSPELAHNLTIGALHRLWAPKLPEHDSRLGLSIAGIRFPTPIGLAAGFDKDAKAPGRMLGYGFGFVEVGTVTPEPQPGNSGKRAFRLEEDEAIINRFGFNSAGHEYVARKLSKRHGKPGIVGINLGANKNSPNKIVDYVRGVTRFAELGDYLTINVSSPNTPGLRDLQSKRLLTELIAAVVAARDEAKGPPIFLKVSPDLTAADVADIVDVLRERPVEGVIVGNTTITRPKTLRSKDAAEPGGLSGAPLKAIALTVLKQFYAALGHNIPLIGVGGISSARDAYDRIRAGASLVQLYTALAYRGPGVAVEIEDGLVALLERDGFSSIAEAIGVDAKRSDSSASVRAKKRSRLRVA